MRNLDSIIFDLDGTLWDTCASCAIGWNKVRARHAIPFREVTADDVRSVCGRPHDECLRTIFAGLPKSQLQLLIEGTVMEDNRVVAERGGDLYPGVLEGLQKLKERYRLFIVSNCQSGYIETFLKWSGTEAYFEDIECFGNTRFNKGQNILSVVRRNSLRAPVYIGDTTGDQSAAREAGVPFLYVRYGFGQVEVPAERSFGSFTELARSLLLRSSGVSGS